MEKKYGILLIEKTEVILRIYEVHNSEWKLISYQSTHIRTLSEDKEISAIDIAVTIAEFLSSDSAQQVYEWKACARSLPLSTVSLISEKLGLEVENLSTIREEELLCKGMFTELW